MRSEVSVRAIREGEDAPAAAWFDPATATVVFDTSIGLHNSKAIAGLIAHEGSHSRYSNWLSPAVLSLVSPAELAVLHVLEESRIERFAVNDERMTRAWLRACFNVLLADGFSDPAAFAGVGSAINNWALVWGRVHGGIIFHTEAEPVDNLMRERFGNWAMDQFDDLLAEYNTLYFGTMGSAELDPDAARIARDWVTLVRDLQDTEDNDVDAEEDLVQSAESLTGDQQAMTQHGGDDDDANSEPSSGDADGGEDADGGDEDTDGSTDTGKDGETKGGHSHGTESRRVFDEVASDVSENANRSEPVERTKRRSKHVRRAWKRGTMGDATRKIAPGPELRRLVTKVAKRLEEDSAPATTRARTTSELPPGRMRSRAAMQVAADRVGGRMSTARPWAATRRTRQERPPVIIGVATDISGSMGWAETQVAEFTYVMSNAGQRIGARFAAVTFGDEAIGTVEPGEVLDKVPHRSAMGGTEVIDYAMAALDAKLRFTDRDVQGRKLLIIVSDWWLVKSGEYERMNLWAEALPDDVEVVVVGVDGSAGDNAPEGWAKGGQTTSTAQLIDLTLDLLAGMARKTKSIHRRAAS